MQAIMANRARGPIWGQSHNISFANAASPSMLAGIRSVGALFPKTHIPAATPDQRRVRVPAQDINRATSLEIAASTWLQKSLPNLNETTATAI